MRVGLIQSLNLISIHAPSRERPGSDAYYNQTQQFQSTLPRGSDRDALSTAIAKIFQSTLPRGSDSTQILH